MWKKEEEKNRIIHDQQQKYEQGSKPGNTEAERMILNDSNVQVDFAMRDRYNEA